MGEKVRWRLVSPHLTYTPITCQWQHGHVQPDTPDYTCHTTLHCDSCSYHHSIQCPTDIKVLAFMFSAIRRQVLMPLMGILWLILLFGDMMLMALYGHLSFQQGVGKPTPLLTVLQE